MKSLQRMKNLFIKFSCYYCQKIPRAKEVQFLLFSQNWDKELLDE